MTGNNMTDGILYVATEEKMVEEAVLSAKSVKKHNDYPLCIVAASPDVPSIFDEVVVLDDPEFGFSDKIEAMVKTPFDNTLYLDTDIYVDGDISPLFDLLDSFNIGAAINHDRTSLELDSVPESFPEYNTGVVVYDSIARDRFIGHWSQTHEKTRNQHPGDQASFRKAIFESDLRLATIPPEYNCMVRYPGHAYHEVRVFHNRLLDIDSMGADKKLDTEQAIRAINSEDGHRVFYPAGGLSENNKQVKTVPFKRKDSWYRRIRLSLPF